MVSLLPLYTNILEHEMNLQKSSVIVEQVILTQPILFIHTPSKSKFPSDIIKHFLGIFVMPWMYAYCSYNPVFLGASFIKLAYAFMIQEVQYAEIN